MGLEMWREKLEGNIQRSQFCPEQCHLPALSQVAPRAMVSSLASHPLGTVWGAWAADGTLPAFLRSAPLGWAVGTQMVCPPPAHPSPNAPRETGNPLTLRELQELQVRRGLLAYRSLSPAPPTLRSLQKEPWGYGGHRLPSQTRLPVPKPA